MEQLNLTLDLIDSAISNLITAKLKIGTTVNFPDSDILIDKVSHAEKLITEINNLLS